MNLFLDFNFNLIYHNTEYNNIMTVIGTVVAVGFKEI